MRLSDLIENLLRSYTENTAPSSSCPSSDAGTVCIGTHSLWTDILPSVLSGWVPMHGVGCSAGVPGPAALPRRCHACPSVCGVSGQVRRLTGITVYTGQVMVCHNVTCGTIHQSAARAPPRGINHPDSSAAMRWQYLVVTQISWHLDF